MTAFRSLLVAAAFLATLASCESDPEECVYQPDIAEPTQFRFKALQNDIADISTKNQLVSFLGRHVTFRDGLLGRANYPDDSVFINANFSRFSHPSFDTLLLETQRVFGDGSTLRQEFELGLSNLKYYYPDYPLPTVETAISGLATDLVVTDSMIVVSLDYYLGTSGAYRPQLYSYLLTRYEPEDIVPSCFLILGISPSFNHSNQEDKSVLADMISYGKAFYFAKHMLPCVPDSVFLWYTDEEMKGAKENEDLIWARLVEDQVLFTTSHLVKQRYLGERPKTLEVGEKCPGRIAQWVGWQIVNAYMERHPDTTLPELMAITDAPLLFRESGYRPQ